MYLNVTEGVTFKGLCCSGCVVLVRMELQRQFPVSFLKIIISSFFVNAEHFVIVLAPFYSKRQEKKQQSRHEEINCTLTLANIFYFVGFCKIITIIISDYNTRVGVSITTVLVIP